MCAANTIINTMESQNKKGTKTTHCTSTSLVVYIVLTCVAGQTMMGSPQTRSAGQVRKSPRQNKVGQKTGKVRKNTSATRRSLNGKLTGKRIAAKPAPKVDVASDDVDSNDEVEEQVDNNHDARRQKTKDPSNAEVGDVLEQPMRKQIVSSREGAMKRKKRPGKARKPVRAPKLDKSSASYDDKTDDSDGDDGKLFTGRIVQKPTIAAAVEALDGGDDDDDDDDCADKKEAGDHTDEEDEYATATSHEETPPRRSKKQRRLYDKDVEEEDRKNRASRLH